jgi:hypothetical protein
MKTVKMSFESIKDILSRDEMKKVTAGSGMQLCWYQQGNTGGWGYFYQNPNTCQWTSLIGTPVSGGSLCYCR